MSIVFSTRLWMCTNFCDRCSRQRASFIKNSGLCQYQSEYRTKFFHNIGPLNPYDIQKSYWNEIHRKKKQKKIIKFPFRIIRSNSFREFTSHPINSTWELDHNTQRSVHTQKFIVSHRNCWMAVSPPFWISVIMFRKNPRWWDNRQPHKVVRWYFIDVAVHFATWIFYIDVMPSLALCAGSCVIRFIFFRLVVVFFFIWLWMSMSNE